MHRVDVVEDAFGFDRLIAMNDVASGESHYGDQQHSNCGSLTHPESLLSRVFKSRHFLGGGSVCLTRWAHQVRYPSLRLKNGLAQDDSPRVIVKPAPPRLLLSMFIINLLPMKANLTQVTTPAPLRRAHTALVEGTLES
jgi:hypothetical protein